MADFRLQIVTSQSTVFDEPVTAVTLPGEAGSFGVLAHHAPAIVAVLRDGPVTIRQGTREEIVRIESGFLEVSNNEATLLAEGLKGLEAPQSKESEDE